MTQIVWWTDVNRVWTNPWGPWGPVIILAYQYFIVSSSSTSFLKKKTVGYPSQKFGGKFLWGLKDQTLFNGFFLHTEIRRERQGGRI